MSKLLEIVKYPSKILLTPCEEVADFDDALKELVGDMIHTMLYHKGIGIAANQVGIGKRMFIAAIENKDGIEEYLPFINPSIEEVSGPSLTSKEYCLSLPGIGANINARRGGVTLSAFGLDGMPFYERYINKNAVIIQHEMEHLDGRTMLDSMGHVQRMLAKDKLKRKRRNA